MLLVLLYSSVWVLKLVMFNQNIITGYYGQTKNCSSDLLGRYEISPQIQFDFLIRRFRFYFSFEFFLDYFNG